MGPQNQPASKRADAQMRRPPTHRNKEGRVTSACNAARQKRHRGGYEGYPGVENAKISEIRDERPRCAMDRKRARLGVAGNGPRAQRASST